MPDNTKVKVYPWGILGLLREAYLQTGILSCLYCTYFVGAGGFTVAPKLQFHLRGHAHVCLPLSPSCRFLARWIVSFIHFENSLVRCRWVDLLLEPIFPKKIFTVHVWSTVHIWKKWSVKRESHFTDFYLSNCVRNVKWEYTFFNGRYGKWEMWNFAWNVN